MHNVLVACVFWLLVMHLRHAAMHDSWSIGYLFFICNVSGKCPDMHRAQLVEYYLSPQQMPNALMSQADAENRSVQMRLVWIQLGLQQLCTYTKILLTRRQIMTDRAVTSKRTSDLSGLPGPGDTMTLSK